MEGGAFNEGGQCAGRDANGGPAESVADLLAHVLLTEERGLTFIGGYSMMAWVIQKSLADLSRVWSWEGLVGLTR